MYGLTGRQILGQVMRYLLPILACCTGVLPVFAAHRHDSLVLKNNDVIVGEIKSLDKGVLQIETDYSKNDFSVEWSGVKQIYSMSHFLIILKNGRRLNGIVHSNADSLHTVTILTVDSGQITTTIQDVVFLKGVKSTFLSRVTASIDLGVSLTKANNLRQYNNRTNLGYLAEKWELTSFYSDLRSKQDSVAETRRSELGATFRYFLPRDWFVNATPDFLSNTEQAIKLRTTGKIGAGKYLVHTNKMYYGMGVGLSLNNETFSNETPSRNSLEAYGGAEVNLFDLKNVSLLSNVYVYAGLTEAGRWRTDFSLDTKYDLPLNFYIRIGTTVNYDNQPAVAGKEIDYVLTFSVGWELKL